VRLFAAAKPSKLLASATPAARSAEARSCARIERVSDEPVKRGITRRQAIAATLGGAVAAAAGVAGCNAADPEAAASRDRTARAPGERMPVVYIPHGGGPWPFVDMGFGERREIDALAGYLRDLPALTSTRPRALLVVSAHWEEAAPTVMTSERPPMLYDYYGFPPESYQITWPAPGAPNVAARVQELLRGGGFQTAANTTRGFDHGTFVPLKLAYPKADVPAVQLSLKTGLDSAEHLAIGRALAPLRDEGVFIVGSGMSYHNMRGFGGVGRADAETFDSWLREAATAVPADRTKQLTAWSSAPAARAAHPREEHLLPLMVIAGAANDDRGQTAYNDTFANVRLSAFHYG
jgi:aromatic ring-opening dioxygenase catalytic subunit (LigB family)